LLKVYRALGISFDPKYAPCCLPRKITIIDMTIVQADIEQPLTQSNLINLAHILPKPSQDVDLHLVETFHEVVQVTVYAHPAPMHPFEQWEKPAEGGTLRRLIDWVGKALLLTHSGLMPTTRRHRRAQHRHRHAPQQPLHPSGLLAKERRDKNPGGCEQPAAPFHLAVGFVSCEDLSGAPVPGPHGGPQPQAALGWRVAMARLSLRATCGSPLP